MHIVETQQPAAERRQLHLETECTSQKIYCSIDSIRFIQAFVNIISNAIKYAPAQSAIRVVLTRTENNMACIEVHDDGPGIPLSFQPYLFEKFSQANPDSQEAKGSSGLGLNISKTIIEALGGYISFKSSPEEGTSFFVFLPLDQEASSKEGTS